MNILFLSLGVSDNIENKGIYTDLIREFRKHAHDVYVFIPCETSIDPKQSLVKKDGVYFLYVETGQLTKTSIIKKGINTLLFERRVLKSIKRHLKNITFDLILYSTPPITFGKVLKYVKKKDKALTYLMLKDIFPQNAVDLKMFSKINPIYWHFRRKEKSLYNQSDGIGCMSQANVEYILKHNQIEKEKVEICPNSIELETHSLTFDEKQAIRKQYDLPIDKTVFVYGGNLGRPQGVDFILEVIEENKQNETFMLIVGSGTEFKRLDTYLNENNINNVKLVTQLPTDEYERLIQACDVGLIFLDYRFTIPNFPSRLLSYLKYSLPVLTATDRATDIGRVVEENNFGFAVSSNCTTNYISKMNALKDEKLRSEFGKNARQYLEKHYDVKDTYQIIVKHLKGMEDNV